VHNVLCQRFSISFNHLDIRPYIAVSVTEHLWWVRNLVWECDDHHTDFGTLPRRSEMLRQECKLLANALPGLRRVDLQLRCGTAWAAEDATHLVGVFKHVPEVTLYLEMRLKHLKEEIDMINMNSTHGFQTKIIPFSVRCVIPFCALSV
jgi:hypothetical protein